MKVNPLIVYKDISSPVGLIRLIASNRGLMAVLWEGEDYTRTKLPGAVKDEEDAILVAAQKQLKEYFAKERKVFDIPLDLQGTEFQLSVWKALLDIPYGTTQTYSGLARKLGDSKAVRAVGGALNKNPVAIIVPCHRVVGASGKLVGFAGGLGNKSILLDIENGYKMPTLF